MSTVGFREFKDFERPSPDLVNLFKDLPVPNIDDNMFRMYSVDAHIRPLNKAKLLGVAFTVKVPAGDNLMIHRALDIAKPGDVLMIDGKADMTRALFGEIMVRYAKKRGLKGIVADGCTRDSGPISEMIDFPVYARGANPNGPYKNGPGEINVPVSVGGVVVFPGDIIVGDADGIVVIRPEDAIAVAEAAKKQNALEEQNFIQIEEGTFNRDWIMKALQAKGCSFD